MYCSSQFIEDVREVMGVPEWMLTVDSRKTKTLYNGNCIQFLLHFKGIVKHTFLTKIFVFIISVVNMKFNNIKNIYTVTITNK